jgi:ankyrin repeat protein
MVELLLQFGPDVNISERSKSTPLHCAASQGDLALVQMLLGMHLKSLIFTN